MTTPNEVIDTQGAESKVFDSQTMIAASLALLCTVEAKDDEQSAVNYTIDLLSHALEIVKAATCSQRVYFTLEGCVEALAALDLTAALLQGAEGILLNTSTVDLSESASRGRRMLFLSFKAVRDASRAFEGAVDAAKLRKAA